MQNTSDITWLTYISFLDKLDEPVHSHLIKEESTKSEREERDIYVLYIMKRINFYICLTKMKR